MSESVVATSDYAVISRDLDGVISGWNHGAKLLYGYSLSEAVGLPFQVIVPIEQRAAEWDTVGLALRGDLNGSRVAERLSKSGRLVRVLSWISPIRDATGDLVGVSSIERGVGTTEGPARLDIGEAYLRSAFDDAPIGIALIGVGNGADGALIRVNRALCALTGYAASELEDLNVYRLVHADDVASRSLSSSVRHFVFEFIEQRPPSAC